MKLSIIIPAYNAADTIVHCLDSILVQEIPWQWEVLVINDGSQDETAQVVADYAHQHPEANLRLISQENGGLASARNLGLDNAVGDWVWFVDADDYAYPGGIGYLINHFWAEDLDMIKFGAVTLDPNFVKKTNWHDQEQLSGKIIWEGSGHDYLNHDILFSVCFQLYRKEFIGDLRVRHFPAVEDITFNFEFMLKNPRIRSTSVNIYRYTVHSGSLVTARGKEKMVREISGYKDMFLLMTRAKSQNPHISDGINRIITNQFIPFFSRFLSANLDKKEFTKFCQTFNENHIVPIVNTTRYSKVFNYFMRPSFWGGYKYAQYKIFGSLYRKIFVPFILPKLSRQ